MTIIFLNKNYPELRIKFMEINPARIENGTLFASLQFSPTLILFHNYVSVFRKHPRIPHETPGYRTRVLDPPPSDYICTSPPVRWHQAMFTVGVTGKPRNTRCLFPL